MTLGQQRLSMFVEWVVASSQDARTPLGRDRIVYGPYAVFVPQELALPPTPANLHPDHLPLWIPEQQAIPTLPPFTQAAPPAQATPTSRIKNIVWQFEDGRFLGALLGLTDPEEPLQSVFDRQTPNLDLDSSPALFLPLWDLDAEARAFVEPHFPVVRL